MRLRNPTGSVHYIETYPGETVLELKKWIAEEYGCPSKPITLKHGEDVISDETLTMNLPKDGFITICLLQDSRVAEKEARTLKKRRARRKQLKGMEKVRKVLIPKVCIEKQDQD